MAYKNKEDKKAYSKKYYAENKEKENTRVKAWAKENTDYYQDYRNKNKERKAELDKLYRAANPEKEKEKHLRRMTKKKGNGVFIVSKRFIKNLYNSPCRFCGGSDKIEADHILPISRGGRHSEGNLQPLCKSCNNEKRAKLWIEFITEKKG